MKKVVCCILSFCFLFNVMTSSCVQVFANSGTFLSYRLFDCTIQMCDCMHYNLCPEQIIGHIENDDIDSLQEELAHLGSQDPVNTCIRPDQIMYSDWYKCVLCRKDPDIMPISLLEYAFSCGSVKCCKYLLMNGAECFNKDSNDLMICAVISGNFELIRLAEQRGGVFDLACLYALLRLAYNMDTEKMNSLLNWVLEHDFIHVSEADDAEIALSFLLLSEAETDNPDLFFEDLRDEDSPIRRTVDLLVSLSKNVEGLSLEFVALVSSVEKTGPICIYLKDILEDYIRRGCSDVEATLSGVFLSFLLYHMPNELERSKNFFRNICDVDPDPHVPEYIVEK